MLKRLADNTAPGSLATRMRRARFAFFVELLDRLHGDVRVLDVGGSLEFWKMMGYAQRHIHVTILNQAFNASEQAADNVVVGDARDMRAFRDQEFDVAFSNSVIEHIGVYGDQARMASEIRRVARRYFVQTPNKYFPIEPRFLVPGFQFLPLRVRATLLARRDLGWYKKAASYADALQDVTAVRLLTRREMCKLFPEARLYQERFFGLTKSFVAYHGWD